MSDKKLKINSSWDILKGPNIATAVIIKCINAKEEFTVPDLAEIVSVDRSILLEGTKDLDQPCDISIKVPVSNYLIGFICMVTDCPYIEIFKGQPLEYINTITGDFIDSFEETTTYRYDISTDKCSHLTMKLIHPSEQRWIYGMTIFLIRSEPNIYTSNFNSSINLENVKAILSKSSQKLSPNAEKCKSFLQSYMSSNKSTSPPNMQMLMSLMCSNGGNQKSVVEEENKSEPDECNGNTSSNYLDINSSTEDRISMEIKAYVDLKIEEVTIAINEKLTEMEMRQNEKLDRILNLLQSRN